jgi:hypothetical protein
LVDAALLEVRLALRAQLSRMQALGGIA